MNGNEYLIGSFNSEAAKRGLTEQIHKGVMKAYPDKYLAIMLSLGNTSIICNRKSAKHGHADIYNKELMLSANLLKIGSIKEQNETFIHEVGHLVDGYAEGSSCGHGANWKRVMRCLGQEPHRTKNLVAASGELPTDAATAIYECVDCGHKWLRAKRWPHNDLVNSMRWHPACRKADKPGKGMIYLAVYKGQNYKRVWPVQFREAA